MIAKKSVLKSNKKIWECVQTDYGDRIPVKIFLLWYPFLRFSESLIALTSIVFLIFRSRKTLVYTRVRYVALISTILHFQTIFESHSPPINSFSKLIDRWLDKRNNCNLALISFGLESSYIEAGVVLNKPIINRPRVLIV